VKKEKGRSKKEIQDSLFNEKGKRLLAKEIKDLLNQIKDIETQ